MKHMNQDETVLKGVVYFRVGAGVSALKFTSRKASGLFRSALRLPSPTVFLIAFIDKKVDPQSPCVPRKRKQTLVFVLRKSQTAAPGGAGMDGPCMEEPTGDFEECWVLDAFAAKEPYLMN